MADSRYTRSESYLQRALRSIPLGSQTFSKSKVQFPYRVSPYFIERGEGSRVWDVDDNCYIDFINGLSCISLGYNDPDVNRAVADQLLKGVSFSLPHRLEFELAERLCAVIPCCEQVRYGKNGSDATAGAVRVARAYTGRDHVAVCGYHGWQDWYIGSTSRNLGVPEATRDLTHGFVYNDLDSLKAVFEKYSGQVAAVIMEPMNIYTPEPGFLEGVEEMTRKHGAVLIFDEIITGFRWALGGAQEYFGITPDLATFGKGVANGFPLSIVTGKRELMSLMEQVFFSFTFGGETLSLAAALAVLDKMESEPVIDTFYTRGRTVSDGIRERIKRHGLESVFTAAGHDSWPFLLIGDTDEYSQWEIRTFYMQEMFARGILLLGMHNISYAHTEDDVAVLLSAYDEVFSLVAESISCGSLRENIKGEILEPLFEIR